MCEQLYYLKHQGGIDLYLNERFGWSLKSGAKSFTAQEVKELVLDVPEDKRPTVEVVPVE